MSTRITVRDVETVAGIVSGYLYTLNLLGDGERLAVQAGSRTYGRAWRVFVTGGTYGTAFHNPPFGNLASQSAAELFGKLSAAGSALYAVSNTRP